MTTLAPEETIVSGTTRARSEFRKLFDLASRGTPVTIVAGDRAVTMLARERLGDLIRRVQIAEETASLLSDPEILRKLMRSLEDISAKKGISPAEARRLLGIEGD